jgi:hypothetical protein
MSGQGGMNLVLAIRDHAVAGAEELEQAAAELRARAVVMEGQAEVLRKVHAVAAPYFPAPRVRMLEKATG